MTRTALSTLLCLLALGAGLATALVQAENHAEAFRLDDLWRECRMLEAVNDAERVEVLTLDLGPNAGLELELGTDEGELAWEATQ